MRRKIENFHLTAGARSGIEIAVSGRRHVASGRGKGAELLRKSALKEVKKSYEMAIRRCHLFLIGGADGSPKLAVNYWHVEETLRSARKTMYLCLNAGEMPAASYAA